MKKTLINVLLSLLAAFMLLLCSACGNSAKSAGLDTGAFGADFETKYSSIYPRAPGQCNHSLFVQYSCRQMLASDVDSRYSDDEYHYLFCPYYNCEFGGHFYKHSDTLIFKTNLDVTMLADGNFYHPSYFQCPECLFVQNSNKKHLVRYLLCKSRDVSCRGECLQLKSGDLVDFSSTEGSETE